MSDGVLKSEVFFDESSETLTHVITQPSEDLILDRNAELRKNEGCICDLGQGSAGGSWGRQIACIPENLLLWATKNGYDIYNKDSKFASKELFRFLNSEKGKPCLIRGKI